MTVRSSVRLRNRIGSRSSALRITVLFALCISMAACSSSGKSSSGTGGGTVSIGVFQSFTGPDAAYGPEAAAGCIPAVDLINANGGILGHQASCPTFDDKGDPADAVPIAERMLSATSNLIGVLGVGVTAGAVLPITEPAHMPVFTSDGEKRYDNQTNAYFWRMLPADDVLGAAMTIAAQRAGYTRAAAVFTNDISSQGALPGLVSGFPKIGGKLVDTELLPADQPSYRSDVERLIAANPQVIITELDPQTAATFLSEYFQLTSHVLPIISDTVALEPQWIQAVSGAIGKSRLQSSTTLVASYAPLTTPAYETFTKALLAAHGVPNPSQWNTDLFTASSYDGANIFALAAIEANSLNPQVINSYIPKIAGGEPGAVTVGTFAAGVAALRAGKHVYYVGACGATVFDQFHNSTGEFALEKYQGSSTAVTGVITAADLAHFTG